ncbi:glycosyltransferase family 4 protein [Rubrivirga marina]|uniref:Glycosyl transferase family 1 domain-containing protein n=1 Tax=Rubrivirga marina TaxID=1196024 RepID=A0A271IZH0_9BACT|nr:glycosyltransferase [Rubrivirga marina]PAP76540.1 hypothetical protein BSZ37_08845 [Rubrivirga marina]
MTPATDRPVAVVGRFPPPIDGQAIATERLAALLTSPEGGSFDVSRHDVGPPDTHFGALSERLGVGRVLHFLRRPRALRRELRAHPEAPILWPSISPSALGHARDLLTVVPAFGRRPVVGVVHRGDFDQLFRSPATAATGRALVRRLRGIVFLSESLADRCAPFVPDAKRWVVPNTIDAIATPSPHEVAAARDRRRSRAGVRVLFLSNMIPSKGYDDVLDALAALRDRGVEAHGTFVGRWPSDREETAFHQRIDALGLGDRVGVLGGVSDRERLRALLLDADVFALPTAYPIEAQPLTVIEALAAGTPVVVTRQGGLPEMITDGVEGRFVPAHSPDAVAEAVEALAAADRWATASVAARARFEAAFSPEAVGARWQDVLARL